jgi:6,7-dimethyl-8-ribityllumazine synthase
MQGGAIQGTPEGKGLRIGVVVSRFNEVITRRLAAGARETLRGCGVEDAAIFETWTPGAWELPLAAQALARRGDVDALVALGCIIRGETSHHAHLAREVLAGLSRVSLDFHLPIGLGVLTTDTLAQAEARSSAGPDNKGCEAALAAMESVWLLRRPQSG